MDEWTCNGDFYEGRGDDTVKDHAKEVGSLDGIGRSVLLLPLLLLLDDVWIELTYRRLSER